MAICNRVKIISDSTCDLSPELIAKYNIDILPLHILLGENDTRMEKTLHRIRFMPGPMNIRRLPKPLLRHWKPLLNFSGPM